MQQANRIVDILKESNLSEQDAVDIIQSVAEIMSRTGWGSVAIMLEGAEISEITISHRRKPKVERRAIKVQSL